jgi:hypothetical protein
VMTWNAGASTPFSLQHSDKDATFIRDLLQSSDSPDIIVFGFQELVDLEDKKTVTSKSPINESVSRLLIICRKFIQIVQEERSVSPRTYESPVPRLARLFDSFFRRLHASK